jgi:energy-coupling factor transport system permease protein
VTGLPTGQFIPGSSPLHRLDARVKLACLLLLTAAAAAAASWVHFVLLILAAGAAAVLSRLPPGAILGQLRQLRWFFLTIFAMNAFFSGGGTPLWSWGILSLTAEGCARGAGVAARVALVLVFSGALTCTTPPLALTDAIEWTLSPLRLVRVPVDDAALILSAAIQFIPTLLEEAETLRLAQTARGARFESRNPLVRASCYPALAVPIFLAAFRRADELAMAMEARGCRGGLPLPRRSTRPRRSDAAALTACAAVCAACLF